MTDTAADDDASTRCPNCGQGIPTANFAMHELHCARNLTRCSHPGCTSVFPATEEEDHMDDFHALRFCECGARMENQFYDRHRTSEVRPAAHGGKLCGAPRRGRRIDRLIFFCGEVIALAVDEPDTKRQRLRALA